MVTVLLDRVAVPFAPTLTPILVVLIVQSTSLTVTPLPTVMPLPVAGQAAQAVGLPDNNAINAPGTSTGKDLEGVLRGLHCNKSGRSSQSTLDDFIPEHSVSYSRRKSSRDCISYRCNAGLHPLRIVVEFRPSMRYCPA
ncbi:hypothetical protein D3C73_1326580 [compost metagenome]